jgi:DNA topoisomerase-2
MHLFDAESRIKKYATPLDIVDAFCERRLEGYVKRKEVVLKRLRAEAALLRNKVLFLEAVCDGRLVLHEKRDDDLALEAEMESLGLERLVCCSDSVKQDDDEGDADAEARVQKAIGSYKYLLAMPMSSLTHRRKEALDAQLSSKNAEIASAEEKTPEAVWGSDLDALVDELIK